MHIFLEPYHKLRDRSILGDMFEQQPCNRARSIDERTGRIP